MWLSKTTKKRFADLERGAAMVEAAITGVLFVFLLMAVVEFGLSFFDYLTTSNMTRVGVRTASTYGNDGLTDYQVLQKVKGSLATMASGNVLAVVVYKASGTNATVPTACLTASVTGVCNHYTSSDLNDPTSMFGCGATSVDRYWCPTSRLVGASATGQPVTGPPDYSGVYIQVRHPLITGFFGSSYVYSNRAVLRLETQTP